MYRYHRHTYVFVSDPTQGYGLYVDRMLKEANTIPGVTVAQNLFAGSEKDFSFCGVINMFKMYKAADALTFEDRKLIEIIRCVRDDAQILVVDETTTYLSDEVRDTLNALRTNVPRK